MKKIKIAITIIAIIAIILIVFLIINSNNNNKNNNNKQDGPITGMKAHEESKEPGLTEYLTVKNCITKFLNIINKENTSYYTTDKDGNKNVLMSQEDIENIIDSVTSENVTGKIEMLDEKAIFTPIKMAKVISGRVESYIAQGVLGTSNMKYLSEATFIVNLDIQNQTYSIEPIKGNNIDVDSIEITKSKNIEKNKFNSYSYSKIDEQNKCIEYLNNIKQLMLLKPEVAYNYLDDDYKTKRFTNYESFEKYVKNNKKIIKGITLKNYKIGDSGNKILISDQYSNTYKFDIEGTMKYKVQLDNYIVMIDDEVEKYKELSNQQKTAYNVKRWIKMINSKDYEFAYNYLDKTFREKNFGSVENFEKYIKQNWPEYINIKCSNYKDVNEVGTIDGKISERGVSEEELSKVIDKTFIVKLIDDTDFTMSFNVE